MANFETYIPGSAGVAGAAGFAGPRAAVLVSRILDSCSAKECIEDLQLLFTEEDQAVIAECTFAKGVSAECTDVLFNTTAFIAGRNCYSVDVTYFCAVRILAYPAAGGEPVALTGYCCYTKQVLLHGGENGVRTFTSNGARTEATPEASAQVAEPVLLSTCLTPLSDCEPCSPPCGQEVCNPGSNLVHPAAGENTVFCTLGLFSIVSLNRTVQMVIPFLDYAVPARDCASASNDPCQIFESIEFPVRQFFPGRRTRR